MTRYIKLKPIDIVIYNHALRNEQRNIQEFLVPWTYLLIALGLFHRYY